MVAFTEVPKQITQKQTGTAVQCLTGGKSLVRISAQRLYPVITHSLRTKTEVKECGFLEQIWNTSGNPFITFEFTGGGGMLYFVLHLPRYLTFRSPQLPAHSFLQQTLWFPSPATNRCQNSDEWTYIVLTLKYVEQLRQLFGEFFCTAPNTKATPGKLKISVLCVKLNTNVRIPKKNQHRRFYIRDTMERIELSCTLGSFFNVKPLFGL